jgi:hypothetical protein
MGTSGEPVTLSMFVGFGVILSSVTLVTRLRLVALKEAWVCPGPWDNLVSASTDVLASSGDHKR